MLHSFPNWTNERQPIVLIARKVDYCCEICHKAGVGPVGTKVHPGRCREEKTRQRVRAAAARAKQRKVETVQPLVVRQFFQREASL